MSQVGTVVSCEIMMTHEGRSKGSGLVKYKDQGTAARAVSELNDTDLLGRLLMVTIAPNEKICCSYTCLDTGTRG
jgi:RNA recognition motif-containing protein